MLHSYDGTNDKCPLPLVKTRLMLKLLKPGDRCVVRIADKGSKIDIPNYLAKLGFKYSHRQISDRVVELHIECR